MHTEGKLTIQDHTHTLLNTASLVGEERRLWPLRHWQTGGLSRQTDVTGACWHLLRSFLFHFVCHQSA